jgi:SH3 domain-containing YSC84-like protein 1
LLICSKCSKTKGLFAGVSLEGSVIVERKDANRKFYHGNVTARQLLSGTVTPPPEADALIRILNSRVFSGNLAGANHNEMYNDMPVYDGSRDESIWEGQSGRTYGEGARRSSVGSHWSPPSRASTWKDDIYDRDRGMDRDRDRDRFRSRDDNDSAWREAHRPDPEQTFDNYESSRSSEFQRQHFNSRYSDKGPAPGRPTAAKPIFKPAAKSPTTAKPVFKSAAKSPTLGANQAVALYTFEADQPGDLGFKKGDIITITKKTDSKNVCHDNYAPCFMH